MKRIIRLTESDLTRIVRRVIAEQEETLKLVSGLIGVVRVGDDEGRTYVVNKVTPLNCGITEVEFKSGQRLKYGYYKPSEDVINKNRTISFKRFGEGVKASDACKQYDTDEFEMLGDLMFGTKPNEKPNIY